MSDTVTKKLMLFFPRCECEKPIIYHLVKDHNLMVNVYRAKVTHNEEGLFEGVENPLQAGRYHSLCATEVPGCLEQTARFETLVMGVKHKALPIYGVQFHPESILTPAGGKLIENILSIAVSRRKQ